VFVFKTVIAMMEMAAQMTYAMLSTMFAFMFHLIASATFQWDSALKMLISLAVWQLEYLFGLELLLPPLRKLIVKAYHLVWDLPVTHATNLLALTINLLNMFVILLALTHLNVLERSLYAHRMVVLMEDVEPTEIGATIK
jgi:hypothetical protein